MKAALLPVAGVLVRGALALPLPLLRVLAGRPPAVAADLHPEAWLIARLSAAIGPPPGAVVDPLERRAEFPLEVALVTGRSDAPVATRDLTLPGPAGDLRARLYTPASASGEAGPLLVYFHGGGWVVGSIETHDATCRLLAHHAGARVLSIDYRLAPEHRAPAAADDAHAAFEWAVANAAGLGADPDRIAVGGDSAGGNLAAVTAQRARARGGPVPAFQLLIYPACDMSHDYGSESTYAEGFQLTKERMDWYSDQYVPDRARRADPDVSPLLADDLSGLPPAYVTTAAADPLRDEGEAYAHALLAAGVPVALQRQPLLHGFLTTTATRSGREALVAAAGALRQGLAAPARR